MREEEVSDMKINTLWCLGLIAFWACSVPVTAEVAPKARVHATAVLDQDKTAPTTYGLENPDVRRGYEAILAAIRLVSTASGKRAQYQGQIAYALDQTQLDCPTTLAALDMALRQPGLTRASYGALRDVTAAAARCGTNGIAAIDGGPAGLLLTNGPGVGFGGGSSNYGGR